MTEVAESNSSIVRVKIGEREYPVVRSPRCGVCMHPARFAIEEKILLNFGYPSISRWVSDKTARGVDGSEEDWPELSVGQIRHHRKEGHCPQNDEMINALTEQRARAMGVDLETYYGQFVDHVIANEIILQQGLERLIRGEIQPDVKDVAAAIKLRTEMEAANESHASAQEWQDLMMLYFRTVKEEVNDDQFRKIMGRIAESPAFKAFQAKRTIEGKVV